MITSHFSQIKQEILFQLETPPTTIRPPKAICRTIKTIFTAFIFISLSE
jgi:hypothetical protein